MTHVCNAKKTKKKRHSNIKEDATRVDARMVNTF